MIHRYKRSARELWKFCSLTGGDPVRALRTLEFLREQGFVLVKWKDLAKALPADYANRK